MSKTLKGFLIGLVVGISLINIPTFAEPIAKDITAYYEDIKISINGQSQQISSEPFIVDGSTYVPLRFIVEAFGKDVNWDNATHTISINDKKATNDTFTVNVNKTLSQNGVDLTLNKIEVDKDKTLLSLTLKNNTQDKVGISDENTIILQDQTQYNYDIGRELNAISNGNFTRFPDDILPNIISSGQIVMPTISKNANKVVVKVSIIDKDNYSIIGEFNFNVTWNNTSQL